MLIRNATIYTAVQREPVQGDILIRNGKIDLVLNTLTYGKHPERDGFNLRRMAVELAVPCLTSLDTAREVLRVFANKGKNEGYHHVAALQDYDME